MCKNRAETSMKRLRPVVHDVNQTKPVEISHILLSRLMQTQFQLPTFDWRSQKNLLKFTKLNLNQRAICSKSVYPERWVSQSEITLLYNLEGANYDLMHSKICKQNNFI